MLPRAGEGIGLSGEAGRVTSAMRAVRRGGPRCLRVALVRAGRIEEERLFRERAEVSVGRGEGATFVIDAPGLAARTPVFVRGRRGYALLVPPGVSARIDEGGSVSRLPARADRRRVALSPDARGVLAFGEARLLFQMVVAPPRCSTRLPRAVFGDPERGDWTTTIIAAFSFVAHFGVIGALYSDWVDPVLDEAVTITGVVAELGALPAVPELEVAAAPTGATPGPSASKAAQPSGGRRAGPAPQSPGAGLAAELERIELHTLGALGSLKPATAGVLSNREVPTAGLDAAARSERGISDGPTLAFGSGRTRMTPGASRDLSALGDTRASVRLDDTGRVTKLEGPRPEAHPGPPVVSGSPVSDAARVVAGLRSGFRACYKRALDERPEAAGGVRVTIQVGPGGEVRDVAASATGTLPPSVASCVAARTRQASFQPPSGGAAVIVVPVTFVLQR
ncbi:MAG: AgmX/PglI C-terminal domain-containing protein [Myxococcales bacterium]|nr:AgmX/PglI C-terminal domain-containing protein [Myxococcales bacterium]